MKSGGGEVEEGGSGEGQCGEGWVGGELAPIGKFLSVDFECMTFHFLSEKWILPYFFHPQQSAWSAVAILDCGSHMH